MQSFKKCSIFTPDIRKQPHILLRISLNGILKLNEEWPLEGAMYIFLWENYRGHPDNISFMQFSTKIDGFEQKDSQGFENSYNSYEQYPLEKFFIFTIYQNYTLALSMGNPYTCIVLAVHLWTQNTFFFTFIISCLKNLMLYHNYTPWLSHNCLT